MSRPVVDIVRATEADIPFIMAIERTPGYAGLVGSWERDEHEAALADGTTACFIGSIDGKSIGFVIVQHWASEGRAALIKRIIVADAGKGSGRGLLSRVVDAIFAQTDASCVWLNVYPHNVRAQRSYKAIGFRFQDRATFPQAGESTMLLMVLQRAGWRSCAVGQ